MNVQRLKTVTTIFTQLTDLQEQLELLLEEEEKAYTAIPDSLQNGEKAEKIDTCMNLLTDALSSLSDANASLEEIATL